VAVEVEVAMAQTLPLAPPKLNPKKGVRTLFS
jgi:hypothetical protein